MFFHKQELQYQCKPDKSDAIYARKLQEVLGGQYGEITIAMQYGFQAWNIHVPGKWRELPFGIAAEEFVPEELRDGLNAPLTVPGPHAGYQATVALGPGMA